MISEKDLNVLILTDYVPHHNWMAFATWYSLHKNLPDVPVTILCNRQLMNWSLFYWTRMCDIKFKLHKPLPKADQIELALTFLPKPLLVLEPEVMLVRGWEEVTEGNSEKALIIGEKTITLEVGQAQENTATALTSYETGWGSFVTSKWINRVGYPFAKNWRGQTPNELKIAELWQQLLFLFENCTQGVL